MSNDPSLSLSESPWRATTSTGHPVRVDSVTRLRDFLFALNHPHSFYAVLPESERNALRTGVTAHAASLGVRL